MPAYTMAGGFALRAPRTGMTGRRVKTKSVAVSPTYGASATSPSLSHPTRRPGELAETGEPRPLPPESVLVFRVAGRLPTAGQRADRQHAVEEVLFLEARVPACADAHDPPVARAEQGPKRDVSRFGPRSSSRAIAAGRLVFPQVRHRMRPVRRMALNRRNPGRCIRANGPAIWPGPGRRHGSRR